MVAALAWTSLVAAAFAVEIWRRSGVRGGGSRGSGWRWRSGQVFTVASRVVLTVALVQNGDGEVAAAVASTLGGVAAAWRRKKAARSV